MKAVKLFLAAALALLLVSMPLPRAAADAIYPAPGTVEAGTYLDHLVATVSAELPVTVMAETLPAGVELVTELSQDGQNVFLRGYPQLAGSYNVLFNVGDTAGMSCALTVAPARPLVSTTGNVSCFLDESTTIAVLASSPDGGTLSYQWYFSQYGDNSTGSVINWENRSELSVVASRTGTSYYYCVVTNTNNGQSVSVASQVISISVAENSVTSVSLNALPSKLHYTVGDTLDTRDLKLNVSYANGSFEVVEDGFTVSPTQLNVAGIQTVQVFYGSFSCTYDVAVQEAQEIVYSIGIQTLPYKTSYTVGEALDTNGITVTANTSLGYRTVTSGLSFSPTTFSYAGNQEVTVSYAGQTCTFSVQVQQAQPQEQPVSLIVETPPTKATYTVGETLDISGLVLKQISNRQNSQLIYTGYTCTPNQLTTVGRQLITVQYGALSTSFTVTVTELRPSMTPQPTALPSPTPSPLPTQTPEVSPLPATQRTGSHAAHQSNIGRSLIAVIVITSLVALAVLGAYVYIQNLGGFEEAGERLRELLKRRNDRK